MVYLQVDIGMCRTSFNSSFQCFTDVESTALYLSAANAKKELEDLGAPLYEAVAYRPEPVKPQDSSIVQAIFVVSVGIVLILAVISVLLLKHNRKRKINAPIWTPPIQSE